MSMIVEFLVAGSSVVGVATCWAAVQRHRLTVELQKHRITTDYEVMRPEPVPPPPKKEPSAAQQALDAQKQSLNALLSRREKLEAHISALRQRVADYSDKTYAAYRTDALKALEDARSEQQELVLEEAGLLEMMQGVKDVKVVSPTQLDAPAKPVRFDPGGPVAERVDDPGELRDAELYDEEASRKGAA